MHRSVATAPIKLGTTKTIKCVNSTGNKISTAFEYRTKKFVTPRSPATATKLNTFGFWMSER